MYDLELKYCLSSINKELQGRSVGKHAAHLLRAVQLRKRWSLIATLVTCIFISILSRYSHQSLRSDEKRGFALPAEIIASRLFEIGKQGLQPQVAEELRSDEQEEEDSLKEGMGGGGSDTDGKQVQAGESSAHEVNVSEPEPHAKMQFPSEETVNKVTGEIFHSLNASQQLHKKPLSHIDNWHNFTESEINSLSIVGRKLFLQEDIGTPQDRNFTILAWQHGPVIARRFFRQYGKVYMDPFRFCSVRNCIITYDSSLLDTADAVLFHFHRTRGPSAFPNRTNYGQRWVWLADECPYHTFALARDKNLSHYNGYFNWSMTYRKDSDVPVPYGRTVKMTDAEASLYEKVDYFNTKPNFTAVMGSNCGGKNKRWDYVRELQKYMNVDVYGACGTFKCPGHFTRDCEALNSYKFYLAFENANCRDYITEKVGSDLLCQLSLFTHYSFMFLQSANLQVDGTFKTVPQLIEQLYTVHAVKNNYTIPVVYALLPDKRAETYRRLFAQIKSMVPNLQVSTITSDFELAAITAVKEEFSTASHYGSLFHLGQCLYRKICDCGLKVRYDTDSEFALKIRMLLALAFVPVDSY
ncbi:uncharacterized protein [Macrobrachium rosenbergii]|uniref:uncharacterized protein n=1 Tax=Macrobrachium rosenbergii TaxID=79674 RepID=UPI0034D78F76